MDPSRSSPGPVSTPSDRPAHSGGLESVAPYLVYTSDSYITATFPISNSSQQETETDDHNPSIAWLVLVPLVVGTIAVVTIIGNVFVMIAFWKDHRIHNRVANLLILNLAISDFLVGLLIMPVNLTWIIWNEILGGSYWLLGETFCKCWVVIDNTVVMVSVCTIILISLDRYWLLTKKLRYEHFQTRKRVLVSITVLWVVNGAVYTLLTFGWTLMTGESEVDYTKECELELSYNVYATTVVLFVEFIIPLSIIVCLNIIVYVKIRKRARGFKPTETVLAKPKSTIPPRPAPTNDSKVDSEQQSNTSSGSVLSSSSVNLIIRSNSQLDSLHIAENNQISPSTTTNATENRNYNTMPHGNAEQTPRPSTVSNSANREFARHRRAAIVLAVLVGVFIACWLPYQIVSIINAVCGDDCISEVTWEIVNNLLWCNSFINPFLYAATNVHFKRNFVIFLRLERLPCVQASLRKPGQSSTVDHIELQGNVSRR
ncbi:5-hydroxytryptamine receptor 1B-like [Diadema antillarum]|uniref:5-hydroxytryptamine receptor 1B-like n=1 Tax=Diadema antillarum TaxID=105358 RepID=UPI003A83B12A